MRTISNEKYKNKNPLYVGVVESNTDPTFNYRVKVRIPEIHTPNISTEQLPWAAKVDFSFMGVGDEQDINHCIPEVGSKVLLLAVENDLNSLLYIGCLYKSTNQTPKDEKYLGTYGIYRKDGQFIGVDKIKQLFQLLFNGNIEIVSNNINIKTDVINIDAQTVNITGALNVKGAITSDTDCISAGISGKGHTHKYNPGPGGPTPSQPPE